MKTITFLSLLLMLSTNVEAQTLSLSPVKIWTNNYEIQNPIGLGVSISKNISFFVLKGEYIFAQNERSYYGNMSYGFLLPPLPPNENITSTSKYTAYEFSLAFMIQKLITNMDISIGFGYSFDSYSADRLGSTTGKKNSFSSGSKWGPFIILSTDYYLIKSLSIGLCYKVKTLSDGNMATDSELPFVDINSVRELQFGLSYHFN